jgi:GTP1/Obg family GTP-binding protein
MTNKELQEFAEKVERMCDFFIEKGREADISVEDINVLHKLKAEAADIATGKNELKHHFTGLAEAVGPL